MFTISSLTNFPSFISSIIALPICELFLISSRKRSPVEIWNEFNFFRLGFLHLVSLGQASLLVTSNFLPKTLYYVGVDGTSENPSKDPENAFRPKSMHQGWDHTRVHSSEGHLKMAKILHTHSVKNNVNLYNLGEGFDYNISTEYSKIHYPLTKEIINKIKTQ